MESKTRCKGFSSEEENLLLSLVEKYKGIIENKKSNAVTWVDKEKSWKRIEQEFNANGGTSRSWKQLKEKFSNMKKKAKRNFAQNKKNILQTGGGPPKYNLSETDLAIKDLIGLQMTGLSNPFDSDFVRMGDDERMPNEIVIEPDRQYAAGQETGNIQNECEEEAFMSLLEQTDKENEEPDNWATYTPNKLKRPVSQSLKVHPTLKTSTIKQHKSTKYVSLNYQLQEEKLAFVRLQKEKFLEEHTLRMENLRLKNELLHKKLNL